MTKHGPIHAPTQTPGSLDFLDQVTAQGKRNLRRNLDSAYANILISHSDMAAPKYSGPMPGDIRREQSRRMTVPPNGENLNLYYGVGHQIIVLKAESGAVFVYWRTAPLYLYQEEVEVFNNAYGEE